MRGLNLPRQYEATQNKFTPFSKGDFVRCFGQAERCTFSGCESIFGFYYFSKPNSQISFLKYDVKCLKIEQSHPISPVY